MFFLFLNKCYFCVNLQSRVDKMSQVIKHRGTVENIEGTHVRVSIQQASACASCVAKRMCQSSESKEKKVDVYCPEAASYYVGEEVELRGTLSQGLRATVLAYLVPLVLLLVVLLLAVKWTGDEALSALLSVCSLFPYYLILYAMRKRLAGRFSFTLRHLSS